MAEQFAMCFRIWCMYTITGYLRISSPRIRCSIPRDHCRPASATGYARLQLTVRRGLFDADREERLYDGQHGHAGVQRRGTATSGRYLATEADYLTKHWLGLLYNDPKLHAMRLNPERGSGCKPTPGGIDCWLEGEASCFANKTCEPTRFQFEDLVVMDYDSSSGTWHLVPSLSNDPLARGYDSEAERYRPENRIVSQPWTLRQRRLLLIKE